MLQLMYSIAQTEMDAAAYLHHHLNIYLYK